MYLAREIDPDIELGFMIKQTMGDLRGKVYCITFGNFARPAAQFPADTGGDDVSGD